MKISYLVAALAITVIIVIVAFQNVTVPGMFTFFFTSKSMALTLPILLIAFLGMSAGALYALFFKSVFEKDEGGEEDERF